MNDPISRLGYSKNSPYRNNPYNIINSNNITMANTTIPLLGIDNLGNRKIMKPGNKKNYIFPGNQVMEIPLNSTQMNYKKGGKKSCYLCGGMKKYQDAGFIGPPEYLNELGISQSSINPNLYKEIFAGQRQQEQPLNIPPEMLAKERQSLNQPVQKKPIQVNNSTDVNNPFMNPLIGLNVGLRGLAESRTRQRQNQYMQQQFANDFNQTYAQADNDYGESPYRYLGYQDGGVFQSGGSYKPCNECNQKKSYAKGGTVSKKYEKFLIDKLRSGVTVEELAAQKLGTIEGLSKYANNYTPRAITPSSTTNISVSSPQSNYTTSPLINKQSSTTTSTAAPFYKDAEDKAEYQRKLQNWYRNELKTTDKKSYFAPNRTKIPGVTNDAMTCIDGVCGIMERNGKRFNAGNVDGRYIGNGSFYENAYVKKLEDVYQTSDNFQIGDLIQARVDGRAVPFDSKMIVDIDEDGNYITYGGAGPYIGEGMKYTKDMLKDMVKNKERIVTRPGYSLDKEKLDLQRASYNDPKIMDALNERSELKNFETSQMSPYTYSIAKDAKDYNKGTKKVMDKFIKFANDGDAMNDLVNKTGRTKEEINASLLNTFGILGQENNWGDKGKGLQSRVENFIEKTFKPKGKSIGQGQIKFKDIPEKIKKDFDVKSTKDLYDIDKVLPLMVALDLDNRKTLENWGNKGVLSKKLFGKDNPNLKFEDIPNSSQYTPYLRNQYYPISTEQMKDPNSIFTNYVPNNGEMQYKMDQGSYPQKVQQKWMDNLERRIIRPSILYPDQVTPEEQDYYIRDLQPVAIQNTRNRKMQEGGMMEEDEFDSFDFLFGDEAKVSTEVVDDGNIKELKKQNKLLQNQQEENLALELANQDYETQDFESTRRYSNAEGEMQMQAPLQPSDFNSIKEAIGKVESGGNYSAVSGKAVQSGMYKGQRALGKYQIMPGNLPQWSKEAIGRVVSPSEFLDSPELQEQIAQYRMSKIGSQYGLSNIPAVWLSGKPLGQSNAKDAFGTDAYNYTKKTFNNFEKGGQYEMSQEEINQLVLQGYKFDII